MPDNAIIAPPAPSGNGYINVDLHHVTPRLKRAGETYWLDFTAKQVSVTVFWTPAEALALAAQIVAAFGPIPEPSAEVSDIVVDGGDA